MEISIPGFDAITTGLLISTYDSKRNSFLEPLLIHIMLVQAVTS